jgi:cell division septal protein FtsQ
MKFEEYVQKRDRRGIRAFGVFIIFFILIVVGYTLTIPYFEINKARVEGENKLSENMVLEWADIPLQKCIFEVNLRKIAQRLELRSRIKRAEVKRCLPSTIIIRIEEREPFAYLDYKSSLWEVGKEGIILGKAEQIKDLPIIRGIKSFSEVEKIKEGLKIIQISKDAGLSFLEINIAEGTTGCLKSGIKVYMGDELGYLFYLPLVLADIKKEGRKIEYIDLRFNRQVIIKSE